MEFRKVDKVPATRGWGMVSELTLECMKQMAELEVGEILHLPISEEAGTKEQLKKLSHQHHSGLCSARTKLAPRKFVINQRGLDLYAVRKE